jgi:chitinase
MNIHNNETTYISMKTIEFRIFFLFILLPIISTGKSNEMKISIHFSILEQRIICYYTNWSVYRHTIVPVLYPDDINSSLCTHIHFAFASINPITFKIEPSENHDIHYTSIFSTVSVEIDFFVILSKISCFFQPLYLRLYRLKKLNPEIKFLISVGGWSAGSHVFNHILTNSITRSMFIRNTKEFLIKWKFDGIDLVCVFF